MKEFWLSKEECCGCGACANVCPKTCITMKADKEGFLYPQIDPIACITCNSCEKVCPVASFTVEPQNRQPEAYAAYHKDETIRLASSSGGVFSALAEEILDAGGVVFGAAMVEDQCAVCHIAVETVDGLDALRGSKYLQSNIGKTYWQAREFLEQGRQVLFSGTPCQVEGFKSYLGKEYSGLLCVDLICHGVPSPKLWGKYVHFRQQCAGAPVERTFFRHKKYGWKGYALLQEYSNHEVYEQVFTKDLFMQMFLQSICLRPVCYDCPFKKLNRVSDVTLADFWSCGDYCPDMDDDKGLSLVLVHSNVGAAVLDRVASKLVLRKMDAKQVTDTNFPLHSSFKKPHDRDEFMVHLDAMEIVELGNRYLRKISPAARVRQMIPASVKRWIKKMI